MSIELESTKLFANMFEEDTQPEAAGQAYAYSLPAEDDPSFAATNWPGAMTFVTGLFYVLGVSGLIGGLFAVRTLANLEAAEILVGRIASHSPDIKIAAAILAAQVKYSVYMYTALGYRILVGAACLGVGGLLKKRFDNANNLAILVLGLVIFHNLIQLGLVYATTSSVLDIPGMDKGIAEAAVMFSLGFAGIIMMFKILVYCGVSYYLTRPNIQALFAPAPRRRREISY